MNGSSQGRLATSYLCLLRRPHTCAFDTFSAGPSARAAGAAAPRTHNYDSRASTGGRDQLHKLGAHVPPDVPQRHAVQITQLRVDARALVPPLFPAMMIQEVVGPSPKKWRLHQTAERGIKWSAGLRARPEARQQRPREVQQVRFRTFDKAAEGESGRRRSPPAIVNRGPGRRGRVRVSTTPYSSGIPGSPRSASRYNNSCRSSCRPSRGRAGRGVFDDHAPII